MKNCKEELQSSRMAVIGILCLISVSTSCKPAAKPQRKPLGSGTTQRDPGRAPRAAKSYREYDEATGLECVKTKMENMFFSVGEETELQVYLGPSAIIYTIDEQKTPNVKELAERAHRAWKSGSQVYVTFSTDDYVILRVADDADPRFRDR